MRIVFKRTLAFLCVVVLVFATSITAFAHSGRTDSKGGHKDNKNKSGLGSYHYHCGGYPAHLHTQGYCPYTDVFPSSVSATSEKTTMEVGEQVKIRATVSPSNSCNTNVSWHSSNNNVASVSNGVITAKGSGTVTITAETFNGKKASVKITVKEKTVKETVPVSTMTPTTTQSEALSAANKLYALGLFKGTGTDAGGNPIFDLDRAPTRHEAVTMLVRLLGKDEEAKTGNWSIPFTDVADWAKPYVGYAYANGLTSGTSATTYSGNDTVTATQYLTFVLRALGYDSSSDFEWNRAWVLSDKLGITNGQYSANSKFTRGDVAIISGNTLNAKIKGTNNVLIDSLNIDTATTVTNPVMQKMQGYWRYGVGLSDDPMMIAGQKVIAIWSVYRFDGSNYGLVYIGVNESSEIVFTALQEGTFEISGNSVIFNKKYYQFYVDYIDTMGVSEGSEVITESLEFDGEKLCIGSRQHYNSNDTGDEASRNAQIMYDDIYLNITSRLKGDGQSGLTAMEQLQGYWTGTNDVEGGELIEFYHFSGSNFTCAIKQMDPKGDVVYIAVEEGTYEIVGDTIFTHINRYKAYDYYSGKVIEEGSSERETTFKIVNGRFVYGMLVYTRSDDSEQNFNALYEQVMSKHGN